MHRCNTASVAGSRAQLTLVWMESAYINKYFKQTSRMDKGSMDALVQAATLVQGGNVMAGLHIPASFSERVEKLCLKVEDPELLKSVKEYGACIDFTCRHTMRCPLPS